MNLAEALKNRKVQIGIAAVAIILVASLTVAYLLNSNPNSDVPGTSTSASVQTEDSANTGVSPAAPASGEETCSPVDETGFIPVRYTIEKLDVDAGVLALGSTEDNEIAAPPKDEPATASWWNLGPAAGSNAGQVILSIHTYRNGGAVGNQLYEGGTDQIAPGDVLKLYSADGRVACYEYVSSEKHFVAEFDTNSDALVRYDGDPSLVIVICWDFDAETEDWASRIFFTFKPIVE